MHILWLVRTTLPQAAAACGLAGASDVSGSWLTGQLAALRACPDLHLTVLCVGKADADGTADGVHYRVVRDTAAFAPLLQAERPDLVHIWGTEFDPAAVMADAARASGLPVLFSVQGVMRDCAAHLCDGVPEKYRRSGALWHAIDKIIPGELLDNMLAAIGLSAADAHKTSWLELPTYEAEPPAAIVERALPRMQAECALSQPQALLLLGRFFTAAERQPLIQSLAGELPVFYVPHPAQLLRQPQLKAEAWAELKKLRALL